MEKIQKRLSIVILILVVVFAIFFSAITFITDFMWFQEMGYTDVFLKELTTQLKVGVPTFLAITGLMVVYMSHLKRSYFKKIVSSEIPDPKKLNRMTWLLAAVFGIFVTVTTVSQLWFDILKFANATDFNLADPLFGLDISFYIFRLEFLRQLNEILIGVIVGLDFAFNFAIDTFNIEAAVLMNHAVGYHVMAGVGCLLIMMLGMLSSTEGVGEHHEEEEEEEEDEE